MIFNGYFIKIFDYYFFFVLENNISRGIVEELVYGSKIIGEEIVKKKYKRSCFL